MKYDLIYYNIILKAKSENRNKLNKTNLDYVYYENHHIIPKCLSGSNDKENLVLLTAREHYVCHKLLTYIYKNNKKIACALLYMSVSKHKNKYNISSKDYAYAKELNSLIPMSDETLFKMREIGRRRIFSEETKLKLSKSLKNHEVTDQTKLKISTNHAKYWLNKKQPSDMIEKRSKSLNGKRKGMLGKNHTVETKTKLSELNAGSNNKMYGKSVYQLWIDKYGKEEADKKEYLRRQKIKNYKQKISE